ncbi:hypothetical protein [Xanthocytophaga agilis]|uniref:Uncharacterized protein n=1 Tax=Xanthocytophaga agilis TaxID=3048010 RepID=A0AAE3UHB7_9BACT|nr:hypothetical protein [Xanthocytophaga agilis]MDJ1502488.1 hypothetical protein [Xanthocytophaga agilis]
MRIKELDLDFSGGTGSWFDFWHTHVDWKRKGNQSWKARLPYLKELIDSFHYLKDALKMYPKDYQLWILIDEKDSGEDAVYIHSENPNQDNFPLTVDFIAPQIEDKNLADFINSTGLTVIQIDMMEGKLYYLFDKSVGLPLLK